MAPLSARRQFEARRFAGLDPVPKVEPNDRRAGEGVEASMPRAGFKPAPTRVLARRVNSPALTPPWIPAFAGKSK